MKKTSLTAFIDYRQWGTLGVLPVVVQHLSESIFRYYAEEGIPVHTGLPWTKQALEKVIPKGTHTSTCTPDMVAFICRDMRQIVRDGIHILLPFPDVVRMFGYKLKLSRTTVFPQEHHTPHLIINLLSKPDDSTPSVNRNTGREVEPESMNCGSTFPHIL